MSLTVNNLSWVISHIKIGIKLLIGMTGQQKVLIAFDHHLTWLLFLSGVINITYTTLSHKLFIKFNQ